MKYFKFFGCALLFIALFLKAIPSDAIEEPLTFEAKKKDKKKKYKVYQPPKPQKFKESKLAHSLLDGKRGIEIGASIHNPFGLNALNVDYTDDITTAFKQEELKNFKEHQKIDIVSPGDDLPFKDNVWDFVISAHVIEHFYDPVKTIKEWLRVVKPGGYVYIIAPHKERTFDKDRPRTTLEEIVHNHEFPNPPIPDHHGHYSVWITQDLIDICDYYEWPIVAVQDVDDKVGNGFTVVIQKPFEITTEEEETTSQPLFEITSESTNEQIPEPIHETKEKEIAPKEVERVPLPEITQESTVESIFDEGEEKTIQPFPVEN